tara:strand:- start:122 stop:796 length:675 start_codon:yes stop_codon:yes gene_type:complete
MSPKKSTGKSTGKSSRKDFSISFRQVGTSGESLIMALHKDCYAFVEDDLSEIFADKRGLLTIRENDDRDVLTVGLGGYTPKEQALLESVGQPFFSLFKADGDTGAKDCLANSYETGRRALGSKITVWEGATVETVGNAYEVRNSDGKLLAVIGRFALTQKQEQAWLCQLTSPVGKIAVLSPETKWRRNITEAQRTVERLAEKLAEAEDCLKYYRAEGEKNDWTE